MAVHRQLKTRQAQQTKPKEMKKEKAKQTETIFQRK